MSAESKPLPKLRRDLTIFGVALVLNISATIVAQSYPSAEQFLNFFCIFPSGAILVILFTGYFVFYPFLHLINHYEGTAQTPWMIWLVVDTLGVTFGVPRILYYLAEIFPSRRKWRGPSERLTDRREAAANKPTLASPISPRVD